MIMLFLTLILKKTLVDGNYYRKNNLLTRSTRLSTRSTCLSIRLSTRSICLSTRSTRSILSVGLFITDLFGGCFCIFLKVIKLLFRKAVNLSRFLKKCSCYDALLSFSSEHPLMYKKSNLFVYIFVVNYQFFPNNSVMYPIKLKIDMLYHMINTFRNSVF